MEAAATEYPRQWLFPNAGPAGETKPQANVPTCGPAPCAGRAPSMFENVVNVITKLWALTMRSPNVNKPESELPPYATGTKEWRSVDKEGPAHLSTMMPIFETTDCGMSQLTVPVDYGSYELEDSMSTAGVYLQEVAPMIGCKADRATTRSVPIRKRRRQQQPASKTHSAPGSEAGKGGGCGKNRKNKKRHDLRRDIVSDSMALEMDDCYGYDYREAELLDESNESFPSVGQRYGLSTSFSPSSTGSTTSFHDALADVSILAACLRYADGLPEVTPAISAATGATATTTTTSTAVSPPVPAVPLVMLNRKASSIVEGAGRKLSLCDITEPEASFVMLTDYDVFTTPSASPARRSKNLCKAINSFLAPSNVWHRQCTDNEEDEEEDDEEEEEEDDEDDDDDDDEEDDDEDQDYVGTAYCSDDDDDDSVVFCEEDVDIDDGNSSSGFEERKVRFNTKPVVHVMRAWDFAYRQARKGEWEMAARDRERFRKHIADLEPVLGPALQPALRERIYQQRFDRGTTDPVPLVNNTTLLSTIQEN
uniref:Putative phosphatase-1 catalytic subunit binding region n=1 Tax=Anopheles marajoara TaxID=58244 RepID=A0A2M4BJU3_9DIPT